MRNIDTSKIENRDDLVSFLRALEKDYSTNQSSWENHNIDSFLEAMAFWVEDMDGYYKNQRLPIPEKPDWEDFSIHKYDSLNEKWSNVSAMNIDPLKDICEMKFDDSSICLFGFRKQYGQWTEWRIKKSKMSAEFNEK